MRSSSRLTRTEYAIAVLLNVLFYLFQTWPVVLHPMTSISGSQGDATGSIYDMWIANRFGHLVTSSYVNPMLGWPFGIKVQGSMNYSAALVVLPAQMISRITNELFAYNFLMLLGLTLPGFVAYVFFRRREHTKIISSFGALSFTLFPFHQVAGAGWTTLVQIWVIPLAMIALDNFRTAPSWKSFWTVGAAAFISIITNGYLGLMTTVIVAVCLTSDFFSQVPKEWIRAQLHRTKIRLVAALAVVLIIGILPKVLEIVRGTVKRETGELTTYGLRLRELVQPGPFRRYLPGLFDNFQLHESHGSNSAELSQFVSYTVLILAIFGVVALVRRGQMGELGRNIVLLASLVWCAMSQGLTLAGITLPVPAQLIMRIAPVWRVYSRFGVAIMFVLIILAVEGLDLLSRVRASRILQYVIVILACLSVVVELAIAVPGGYSKFEAPEYARFLSKKSGAVAMYPLSGYDDFLIYERRFWQQISRLPMINGDYATDSFLISEGLQDYREEQASTRLASLHVRWVVVDRLRLENQTNWKPKDVELVEVWRDSRMSIFENRASSQTAIARFTEGAFGIENRGQLNEGTWVGSHASIDVVGPEKSCVRLGLKATPYGRQGPLILEANSKSRKFSGQIVVFIRLQGILGRVTLTSTTGTTNIAGPDPRNVSHYVEVENVTVSPTCGK